MLSFSLPLFFRFASLSTTLPPRQPFPQARAHTCDNSLSSLTRTGLRKNTVYTLRLSVVNPGGPGPPSADSAQFTTASTFPLTVPAPSAATLGVDSIRVTWPPVTDWNARGGLDVVAYYVYSRPADGVYGPPAVVYPIDPASASETVRAGSM